MMDKDSIEYIMEDMITHILLSGNKPDAIYFWKGYIAGFLEWGLFDRPTYDRFLNALPKGAEDDIMRDIFHLEMPPEKSSIPGDE